MQYLHFDNHNIVKFFGNDIYIYIYIYIYIIISFVNQIFSTEQDKYCSKW